MPTQIEVPGEGVLEFPDGMGDEEIKAVLRQKFPPPRRNAQGESKADLAQQMSSARNEGAFDRAVAAITSGIESGIERITPSGILNQPARALGYADPFQPGVPVADLPEPTGTGVLSGVGQLASRITESLTTPENLITLPAAAPSAAVRALFAGQMAQSLPAGIAHAGDVLRDPNATAAEQVVAAGEPLVAAAMLRGIGRTPEWLPYAPEAPRVPIAGTAIPPRPGAPAPRTEPVPIERATPDQAAAQAEAMNRTAETAVDPKVDRTQPDKPVALEKDQPSTEAIKTYGDDTAKSGDDRLRGGSVWKPEEPISLPNTGSGDVGTGASARPAKGGVYAPDRGTAYDSYRVLWIDTAGKIYSETFKSRGSQQKRADELRRLEDSSVTREQAEAIRSKPTRELLEKYKDNPPPQPAVAEGVKEPVKVQEVAKPVEAKAPVEKAEQPKPVEPPKAVEKVGEPNPTERKTPRRGTPEREQLERNLDELRAPGSEVSRQISDLESQRERTQRYSKKWDALNARIDKLVEKRRKLDADPRIEAARQRYRDALAEDNLESVNPITVAKQKSEMGDKEAYNSAKRAYTEEAVRQGFTREQGESMFFDDWSFTINREVGLKELVAERGKLVRAEEAAKEFVKEVESLPEISRFESDRAKTFADNHKHYPDEIKRELDRLKAESKQRVNAKSASEKRARDADAQAKDDLAARIKEVPEAEWDRFAYDQAKMQFEQLKVAKDAFAKMSKEDQQRAKIYRHIPVRGARPRWFIWLSREKALEWAEKRQQPKPTTAPATDIPQGPGARTMEARSEAPESYSGTSLKNAVAELERVSLGLPPAPPKVRQSEAEAWIRAGRTLGRNPVAGEVLVKELVDNPGRGLSMDESAVLLRYKTTLMNELNSAAERTVSSTDPAVKASAQVEHEMLSNKLLELMDAVKLRGTEAGRELNFRKALAHEDFSFEAMVLDRRAKLGGRQLTEKELAETRELADQAKVANDAIQDKIRRDEAKAEGEAAEVALDRAQADISQQQARDNAAGISKKVLSLARQIIDGWNKEESAASDKLSGWMQRMPQGPGARTGETPLPTRAEVELELAKIARAHMGREDISFPEWKARMGEKFGDWVSPYLDAAWRKGNELFDAELSRRAGAAKPAVKKAFERIKLAKGSPEALQKRIAERAERRKDISWHVQHLARYFVEQGVKDPIELVDKVHEVVQKAIPDITRQRTTDLISGYGDFSTLSKDAVSVTLRDLKGQLQQIRKLEDMAAGQAPRKTGVERRTPSDPERRLIKQVEEAKRRGGYRVTDPETQLRTALQAAKTRTENQIKDLEYQIEKKEKIVKTKRQIEPDAELTKLRERRDTLKEVFDEVFAKPELTEAERLALWKQRTRERIAEYEARIITGNWRPKPKPEPIKPDKEMIQLQFEMQKVHRAVMDMRLKDKLAQRSRVQRVIDGAINTYRFSRALMTGGEFSAVLRQGLITGLSRPTVAAKALPDMFRAFRSELNQFRIMEEIMTRDNAPLYQKSGLEFTEHGVRLSSMEEHYMFRVSERLQKTPGFNQLFRGVNAFQRAFTTYLNKLRADAFDAMAETYGKDAVTLQQIANYINVTTGRGSTGLGRFVGQGANTMFFAPRYTISRIQYLLGQPLWHGNKATRKMILKEYTRALIGASVVYGLAKLAGAEVGTDSTSTDFGKIIVGKTRIDPMAGLLQPTVLVSRVAQNKRTTTSGRTYPVRGNVPYGQPSGSDLSMRFIRGKLSPVFGTSISLAGREDPAGEEYDINDALVSSLTPITYGDIIDAFKEHDVPEATALSILAVFGYGVNTYNR